MTLNDMLKQPTTYYKVQFFNKVVSSWKDIQKSHKTIESAKNAIAKNQKFSSNELRIMAIEGKKRYVVG